jgi:carotenoid cleavage dioxygenase-like enzyme
LQNRFFASPGRLQELSAGKMLYDEFGTRAPVSDADRRGLKNQPSVNVIEWDSVLLGLSEGGHPTAVNATDFSYIGEWDFHGTLPENVTCSAHPKLDPITGDGYVHGIEQIISPSGDSLSYALKVYRLIKATGGLQELYSIPLPAYSMIHDLTVSQNYLIFMIPSVSFDIQAMIAGTGPIADYLKFAENSPTRILILRRDGTGSPVFLDQPPSTLFHHGNAYEENGSLFYDTMLGPDGSLLNLLAAFSKDKLPVPTQTTLTRFELDITGTPKLKGRTDLGTYEDFPRFDPRLLGQKARYLYTLEANSNDDPLANIAIIKHDLEKRSELRLGIPARQTWGEPVFVPRPGKGGPGDASSEDQGWILALGYDADADETFLEIRDAETLDFQARVWTGVYFPLGFHGNFY